jgi:predicted lipoprotein
VRLRCAALALICACDAVPAGDGPRRIVVRDVGEDVIEPTYEELGARAAEHRDAVIALVAAPDAATLDAARATWRAARGPWMVSQAFRFGPVVDRVVDAAIDQSPVDPDAIDAAVAGVEPIDDDFVDLLGANKKGFHAIEYLLFDPDVLVALTAEPRRGELLAALARDLDEHTAELRDAWAPEGEAYVERFVDVGAADATFPTIKEAIDGLVNEAVFLSEQVTDSKLGKPLGLDTGGAPRPELEESGCSDNSLDDIAGNLRGLRHVWEALRPLIAERSPSAALRIDAELDAADAAIAAVPRPFAQALLDEAPEALAAWEAVRELRLSLATDVVSLLGATLSFNDNDGD